MKTRTFWLSFCDPDRPEGDQFLGVAIVDVDRDDAVVARLTVRQRFPNARKGPEAAWIAAAVTKTHEQGCNPGGEVGCCDITGTTTPEQLAALPRNTLLSKADLTALGVI